MDFKVLTQLHICFYFALHSTHSLSHRSRIVSSHNCHCLRWSPHYFRMLGSPMQLRLYLPKLPLFRHCKPATWYQPSVLACSSFSVATQATLLSVLCLASIPLPDTFNAADLSIDHSGGNIFHIKNINLHNLFTLNYSRVFLKFLILRLFDACFNYCGDWSKQYFLY